MFVHRLKYLCVALAVATHTKLITGHMTLYLNACAQICLSLALAVATHTKVITGHMTLFLNACTQICMSLALAVAVHTEQHVVYVDSGGTFDTQRLQQVLQHSRLTQQVLSLLT